MVEANHNRRGFHRRTRYGLRGTSKGSPVASASCEPTSGSPPSRGRGYQGDREIKDATPQLLVDGGVENYNAAVDELINAGLLEACSGPNGNHVFQFTDRILVASAQASIVVSEHARHGCHRSEAGGLLHRPTQHPPPAFGVSWSNARRDVLRDRWRHTETTGSSEVASSGTETEDKPGAELLRMFSADVCKLLSR